MWPFVLSAVLIMVGIIVTYCLAKKDNEPEYVWVLSGIIHVVVVILLIPMSICLSAMTTGFYRGYSVGQREGYVTKISQKGVFWKTWEIELQVGTGEMSALQAPHHFSVPNHLIPFVQDQMGNRVIIDYQQWIIMPYSIGESGYEIFNINRKTGESK